MYFHDSLRRRARSNRKRLTAPTQAVAKFDAVHSASREQIAPDNMGLAIDTGRRLRLAHDEPSESPSFGVENIRATNSACANEVAADSAKNAGGDVRSAVTKGVIPKQAGSMRESASPRPDV